MWGELYLEWIMFIMLMALGQFSPGPDMILLTRVALSDGLKQGCSTAAGIATGLMVHAAVAIFFIELLTTSAHPWIRMGLFSIATLYLLWLAYGLLTSAFLGFYSGLKLELGDSNRSGSDTSQERTIFDHYRRGLLCNLLNPKVAIFLAGVVLPFQQLAPDSTAWSLVLWLTIVVEGLALWCLWVKLLQTPKIKHWYSSHFHWIDGFFGVALLALAFLLLREMWSF